MKECPKCHTRYDDSMSFCIKDGCQLIDMNDASSVGHQPEEKKKKGGCLKKILVAVAILVIAVVAFYNYLMNAASYLRVEPNQIELAKAGGKCNVEIDYDGYVWMINHKPNWVDIYENDNDFTIRVRPNKTGQTREGSITIQSGKHLAQVVISQLGCATFINVSENKIKCSSSSWDTYSLSITTDGCGWEAQYPDWITLIKNEDGALIGLESNDGEYRTGKVVFSEDNVTATVYVTQGGNCTNCHGNGEINCNVCYGLGSTGFGMYYMRCLFCGGSGKLKCGLCNGSGKIE